MKATLLVLLLKFSITGCSLSALDQGNLAFDNREYDKAASIWNPLAINGDRLAQYNLGLLWEFGFGSTPKSPAEASQWYLKSAQSGYVPAMVKLAHIQKANGYIEPAYHWYHQAARWGNTDAIFALQSMGRDVPVTDLLQIREERERLAQQEALESLSEGIYEITCALIAGCNSNPMPIPSDKPTSPPYQSTFGTSYSKVQPVLRSTSQCTSHLSCGLGQGCIKPPGHSFGSCMHLVNEYGNKVYNSPQTIDDTHLRCDFGGSCPIGSKCDPYYKTCIRLN